MEQDSPDACGNVFVTSPVILDTPEAKRARQISGLRPFSKDYQPTKRGCSKSGGEIYRWAGKIVGSEKMLEEFKKEFPNIKKKLTLEELRHLSLYMEAIKGDVAANKEISDRLFGKAVQPLEHSGKIGVEFENMTTSELLKQLKEMIDIINLEDTVL